MRESKRGKVAEAEQALQQTAAACSLPAKETSCPSSVWTTSASWWKTSMPPLSSSLSLGFDLEGRAPIQGDWADGVTGLWDMHVEIAMMCTPDGHSRLELSRFLAPPVVADHRNAPVNALGYLRVMFTVEDIDDTLARLRKRGVVLVGEVVQYENSYRLCYIRGPEGILVGLAQGARAADFPMSSCDS